MSRKVQRILISVFLSIISIPLLAKIIVWIVTPPDYVSDGVTDFGYGFISFIIILPPVWIISTILIWFVIKRIFNSKILRQNDTSSNL